MKEISLKKFNNISFCLAIFLIFYMQFKNIEFSNFILNLSLVDFVSFFIFFLCQFIIIYVFFYKLKPSFLLFISLIVVLEVFVRAVFFLSMAASMFVFGSEQKVILMYYWSDSVGLADASLCFLMLLRVVIFRILKRFKIINIQN